MSSKYVVRRGFVQCPVRGRIDVEQCFYCPYCETVDLDCPRSFSITCDPSAMPDDLKVAYQRLSVLLAAHILGSVRKACRERNISRRRYYSLKRRYEAQGLSGLREMSGSDGRL